MKIQDVLATFNRGRVSRLALARNDVRRVAMSAEMQTNWMPRSLGSMMLRPGLKYHGAAGASGAMIPFVYSHDDKAILELTASTLRVWDDGDTLVTRPYVSTSIPDGDFSSLSNWTDADEAGTASTLVSGQLQMLGTGYASAIRRQEISVSSLYEDTQHALLIVIERGPVLLRVGTSSGADDLVTQAVLRTGTHSIAFTPGGSSFWVEFASSLTYPTLIDSCTIEPSGTLDLPTPWSSSDICRKVRWQQSGDVVFCACDGLPPRRIERRPNNSWSVVLFEANDGPYQLENVENIRLTPSAITGAITISSSAPVFKSGHVGALFRMSSQGQLVASDLNAESTFTDPILVTGVTDGRIFQLDIAGTWSGTVSLQRSIGEPGAWVTVATYTSNTSTTYDDDLDNSEIYYRLGIETGNYGSGTAELSLEYSVGSITGVARVTAFSSETSVSAVVLKALGGTGATEVWAEGAWSSVYGWPQAVAIWEGRLWWSGNGQNYGSVSDAFTNHDPDVVGDSAPINRSVGDIAASRTNWMLPLQHLIVGTDGAENSVRSNSFDEPVTPTNYNVKQPSTRGSAQAPAAVSDNVGYFVGRTTECVFETIFDAQSYGYTARDMTQLCPEIGEGGFVRVAVQQYPDRRVHCIRADGTAAVLVRDEAEDVLCWVDVETSGTIDDVVVLPGDKEDRVFYRVTRTIGGATYRFHEEWAREDQCRGGSLSLLADCHISATEGAPTVTLTGLSHLEGEDVVVWADGKDYGTQTVTGGLVTISEAVTNWCVGLSYTARFKSAKLSRQTKLGNSLTKRKRIDHVGLVLADTHKSGLRFGPSFENMDSLPLIERGTTVADDYVWESYDEDAIEFPGEIDTDSRICLEATAPRPCTVLAAVIDIEHHGTS